jgi:hypothetical protein
MSNRVGVHMWLSVHEQTWKFQRPTMGEMPLHRLASHWLWVLERMYESSPPKAGAKIFPVFEQIFSPVTVPLSNHPVGSLVLLVKALS